MLVDFISEFLTIIQALLTIAAGVFAGIWFIRRGLFLSRATVSHAVEEIRIDAATILVRVKLIIRNTGEVRITIGRIRTRLQQVTPLVGNMKSSIADRLANLADARSGYAAGRGIRKEEDLKDGHKFRWPSIGDDIQVWTQEDLFEIEPKESETLSYDFIVEGDVEAIQIYSFVGNESRNRPDRPDIGWTVRSLHTLGVEDAGNCKTRNAKTGKDQSNGEE